MLQQQTQRQGLIPPQVSDRTARPGELVLLRAFAALRWAGLVPLAVFLWLRRDQLDRGLLGVIMATAAAGFTLWAAWNLRRRPRRLLLPSVCLGELALAAALLAADGWVLGWEHTFDPPALGALWPLAAVLTAGVVLGPGLGALAGVTVAAARSLGALAPEVERWPPSFSDLFVVDRPRLIPMLSLVALYGVAGLGAGYVARLQRRAEDEVSSARARDEVARTLHDGVMQTLAIS